MCAVSTSPCTTVSSWIENTIGRAVFVTHVDELVGSADSLKMREWIEKTLRAVLPISTFERWSTVLGYGVSRDRARREVRVNAARVIKDMVKARADARAGSTND